MVEQISNPAEQPARQEALQFIGYLRASLGAEVPEDQRQPFDLNRVLEGSKRLQQLQIQGTPALQQKDIRQLYADLGRDNRIWVGVYDEILKVDNLAKKQGKPSGLVREVKTYLDIAVALGMNKKTKDPNLQGAQKIIDRLIDEYGSKQDTATVQTLEQSTAGHGSRRWSERLGNFLKKDQTKAAAPPTTQSETVLTPEIDPKTEAKVQKILEQYRTEYSKKKGQVSIKQEDQLISELRKALGIKDQAPLTDDNFIRLYPKLYSKFVSFSSLLDPRNKHRDNNRACLTELLKVNSLNSVLQNYDAFPSTQRYSYRITNNIRIVVDALIQIPADQRTPEEQEFIQSYEAFCNLDYSYVKPILDLTHYHVITPSTPAKEAKAFLEELGKAQSEARKALADLVTKDNEFFARLAQQAGVEIIPGEHNNPASLEQVKAKVAPPAASTTTVETPRQPTIEEVHEKMRQQIRQQYGDTGSFVLQFTPNQNLTQDEYMQADAYTKLAREAFQVGEIIYDKQTGILTIPLSPQNQKTATPDSDNEQEAWAKELAQKAGVDLDEMGELAKNIKEELTEFDERKPTTEAPMSISAVEIFNTQIRPFVEGKGQPHTCLQGVEELLIIGALFWSFSNYGYRLGQYVDIQQGLLNAIKTRTVGLQEGTHTSDALDRALSMAELLGLDRFGRCRETLQQARQALKEASLSSDAEKPDIFAGPTPFLPDLDGGSTLPDFTKLADTLEHKSGQDDTRTLAKEAENERAAQERAEQMAKDARVTIEEMKDSYKGAQEEW